MSERRGETALKQLPETLWELFLRRDKEELQTVCGGEKKEATTLELAYDIAAEADFEWHT